MQSFHQQLYTLVDAALKEDIGDGDHSTLSCIPAEAKGKAVLKIKQEGILAGMEVAKEIFQFKEPGSVFTAFKKDGDAMIAGEKAFEVTASVHTILQCERLVLNCMQRMSGIATLTRLYVDKLKGYKTRVLDTRKTTPNYRFALYDMIMLKDNHIDYCGGIEQAIERAHQYVIQKKPGLKIEVETRSIDDVKKVVAIATGKVFRIMLDNFTPEKIVEALTIIKGRFETEASGGINLNNVIDYAATGVDFVSVGALIHQAKSLDLSLKAVSM
jgi:nicotinate-nucleotide pyrophosphorylase (carboxylating)